MISWGIGICGYPSIVLRPERSAGNAAEGCSSTFPNSFSVDGEEIDRQHARGLGTQERRPGLLGPPWRWVDSRGAQDPPHRRRRHPVTQADKFAVDSPVPQPGFSSASRRISRRTSARVEGRPGRRCGYVLLATSSRCHLSMVAGVTKNAAHRSRGRTRDRAANSTRSLGCRRGRATCLRRTGDLMAQNQKLDVLGGITAQPQHQQVHRTSGQRVHQRPQHDHPVCPHTIRAAGKPAGHQAPNPSSEAPQEQALPPGFGPAKVSGGRCGVAACAATPRHRPPRDSASHSGFDACGSIPCSRASRTNAGTGHHRSNPRSAQTAAAAWYPPARLPGIPGCTPPPPM